VNSRKWSQGASRAEGCVAPDGVALGADLSVGGSGDQVSAWTEVVADGAERPEKTLGMLSRLEPLQHGGRRSQRTRASPGR
jgi:hypothetical protein